MKRIIETAVIIGDYHYNTEVVIMFADFATRTNYLLPYTIVLYFNRCVTYLFICIYQTRVKQADSVASPSERIK